MYSFYYFSCFTKSVLVNIGNNGKNNNVLKLVSVYWQTPGLVILNDLQLSLFNSNHALVHTHPTTTATTPSAWHWLFNLVLSPLSSGSLYSKPIEVYLPF